MAVKVEAAHASHPQLAYEAKVYRLFEKSSGFPRVHFCGKDNGRCVMVMDLCGPSLEELFVKCGRRLALPTVLVLAEQLLRRLETVHSRGFVHRDIKQALCRSVGVIPRSNGPLQGAGFLFSCCSWLC